MRCALANAYDTQAVIDQIGAGVQPIANGPFSPGQVGYLEDTGFPLAQDMAKAQELIADYKAEHPGALNVDCRPRRTDEPDHRPVPAAVLRRRPASTRCSIRPDRAGRVHPRPRCSGDFQAFQWRNHGGVDLDAQYIWWHSSTALPVGQLALNFGRIKDDVIDEALDANRGETDPAKKQELAETVNRRFGEQCYNLWGAVHRVGSPRQPDGARHRRHAAAVGQPRRAGRGIAGSFNVASVWVEQ